MQALSSPFERRRASHDVNEGSRLLPHPHYIAETKTFSVFISPRSQGGIQDMKLAGSTSFLAVLRELWYLCKSANPTLRLEAGFS